MEKVKCKCKLCGDYFDDKDMSEEHYPARSVGNNDIVKLDLINLFDSVNNKELRKNVLSEVSSGGDASNIISDYFDNELATSVYPNGRTARTLCEKCNNFLGKYDKAYLKFFNLDGDAKKIKGFSQTTKLHIIKSIFGKFLSIPEAQNEEFDFINFLSNKSETVYSGKWKIYFVKRDFSTDLMGYKDIQTGKIAFDEGVVYELSDDKFIFNLLNFSKHECYPMTNIFDILKKSYTLIEGVGDIGGYHGQVMMSHLFNFDAGADIE